MKLHIVLTAAILSAGGCIEAWAGNCDFVLDWNKMALENCIRELKDEIEDQKLEMRNLKLNICALAMETKDKVVNADLEMVLADACAEIRAMSCTRFG